MGHNQGTVGITSLEKYMVCIVYSVKLRYCHHMWVVVVCFVFVNFKGCDKVIYNGGVFMVVCLQISVYVFAFVFVDYTKEMKNRLESQRCVCGLKQWVSYEPSPNPCLLNNNKI